jgi:serine/threonine protein kinase
MTAIKRKVCSLCARQYEPTTEFAFCPADGNSLTAIPVCEQEFVPLPEPYEYISWLGRGSTSDVYKARDKVRNHLIVLKVLRPEMIGDQPAINRFVRESKLLTGLSGSGWLAGPIFR